MKVSVFCLVVYNMILISNTDPHFMFQGRYFDYMMSYCPMNNIKNGAVYPSCLITGGLHDPRVQASSFFYARARDELL